MRSSDVEMTSQRCAAETDDLSLIQVGDGDLRLTRNGPRGRKFGAGAPYKGKKPCRYYEVGVSLTEFPGTV